MSGFELWWTRGVRALGVVIAIAGLPIQAIDPELPWFFLVPIGMVVAGIAHGNLTGKWPA